VQRFALVLEYDGARFQGWQRQLRAPTVQAALEDALATLDGAPVRVMGASRTDSGVHARGQVAHCDLARWSAPLELRKALNALAGEGLAVLQVWPVAPKFHARRDAVRKLYRYRILNRAAPSPLRRERCWHLRHGLDLDAMREAAAALLGEHDFAAFRGAPGGAPVERTVRTLERLDVAVTGDEIELWVSSRSFLRYMVRNIAGTLAEVGLGRRPAGEIAQILASHDRARAGRTAPACGLCLESIEYPPGALPQT
jgi:tRNA pseudouridine38-40 synthase